MKKHKKTNENCDKKVFKDLEKLAAKFSNCLLKEEQDFLSFHFQQVTFMGWQRFTNLKVFKKPYKLKTVNMLKYMNPQI